jgi:hypothetical protein
LDDRSGGTVERGRLPGESILFAVFSNIGLLFASSAAPASDIPTRNHQKSGLQMLCQLPWRRFGQHVGLQRNFPVASGLHEDGKSVIAAGLTATDQG